MEEVQNEPGHSEAANAGDKEALLKAAADGLKDEIFKADANRMKKDVEAAEARGPSEFDLVHNRLAPMIWALAFDLTRECVTEEDKNARMNAVLNSMLTASLSWAVAVSPADADLASGHYDVIRGKLVENLEAFVGDRDNVRKQVGDMGNFAGRQMLLRHQNEKMSEAIMQLVNVLTATPPKQDNEVPGPDPEHGDDGKSAEMDPGA